MSNDVEEELRYLGVQDDLGDGDSDVTPTNSPLSSLNLPSIIHLPVYASGVAAYDDNADQFYRCDDYDLRSNSSLSWGEDEFEGEATRIVNSLFEQLDQIIYEDDILIKSIHLPITSHFINKVKEKPKKKKVNSKKHLSRDFKSKSQNDLASQLPIVNRPNHLAKSQQNLYDEIERESFSAVKPIPEPSAALISECKDWVENFPHLRVNGLGVDIKRLNAIEELVFDDVHKERKKTENQEEVIEQHGNYENKLQFVTLKLDKKDSLKKPKCPPSRICSGSTDPEVLKEQLLIKVFEMIWPIVSQIIEPLLTQYASYVISQSVQYSSFSRETSSRGPREGHRSSLIGSENIPKIGWRANRPLSASSRPSSSKYRLQEKTRSENINRDELQNFLQIKPLIIYDDRTTPTDLSGSKLSARSSSSNLSLPSLSYQRPVSSKSSSHLLTPRLTNDQRPTSTSSHARLRFSDKYQNLNKNSTIVEDRTSNYENHLERREQELNADWSRHATVLPPIPDVAALVKKKGNRPLRTSSSTPNNQMLSIRGKSLSARLRIEPPEVSTASKENIQTSPQAEPFVSWIVSKVARHSNQDPSDKTARQANKINNNNVPIDKTRYYRRASHH